MPRKSTLILLLIISAFSAAAQKREPLPARDSLPYQKYPGLPAFNLLLQDSATVFNTYNIPEGRPTILMFFSPDCDHCQKTTEAIMEKIDSLQGVNIVFLTPMSLGLLRPFASKMLLNDRKNITVGKDYEFFFYRFYGANFVPYIAIYDRKKKFVKMWEGRVKIEDLMQVVTGL